jgi:hypothetical protein
MLAFSNNLRKALNKKAIEGFPNFPGKKIFGNKGDAFLNQRMTQLQNFFTIIFKDPQIT